MGIGIWPQHFPDMNSSDQSKQRFLACCLRGLHPLELWDPWLSRKPWSPSEGLWKGKQARGAMGRGGKKPQTLQSSSTDCPRGQDLNLEPTPSTQASWGQGDRLFPLLAARLWVSTQIAHLDFSGLFFLSAIPAFCLRRGSGASRHPGRRGTWASSPLITPPPGEQPSSPVAPRAGSRTCPMPSAPRISFL